MGSATQEVSKKISFGFEGPNPPKKTTEKIYRVFFASPTIEMASKAKPRKFIPDPIPIMDINVDDEILVPIYEEGVDTKIKGIVKYVGPCTWLITESKYAEFFTHAPNVDDVDSTKYPKFASVISHLHNVMPVEERQSILRDMSEWHISEIPDGFKQLLKEAYMMIKRNQIISVEVKYKELPPITLWYEVYNCNVTNRIEPFVGGYSFSSETNSDAPAIIDGKFHPDDIEKYQLLNSFFERDHNGPQAISSWITRGLLSTWLRKHDEVFRNLTHPFVGDEEFAKYIDEQQAKDLETLYAISEIATTNIETFRSSLFWIDKFEPINSESILASTTDLSTAFLLSYERGRPVKRVKKLIITPGVRFLDLSKFNKAESEILIIPEPGKTLHLQPLKEGSYAIMNSKIGERSIKNFNEYTVSGGNTIVKSRNRRSKTRRIKSLSAKKTRKLSRTV